MRTDDCYQLGEVIKTHGLDGELSIHLDVDSPDNYKTLESVFLLLDGRLVPFFIHSIHITGSRVLIKFDDVDSIDDAKKLVSAMLYLPLAQLPNLPKGKFYFHDLIGCQVFEAENPIGVVKDVYEGANELLAVETDESEILIPMIPEVMLDVDLPAKKILVSLPDGLLDLYNE